LQDVDASIYRCPQCVGGGIVGVNGRYIFKLDTMDNFELVGKFYFLSDILGKGGGAEKASRTRVSCA